METNKEIPDQIKKWNWGAMLLSPFWCLRHGVWQGWLLLIPIVSFFMPFVLGFKGNVWAWRKEQNPSVGVFLRRQKFWAIAGITLWVLLVGAFFFGLNYSSGVSRALNVANSNSRVVEYLGTPIKKASMFSGTNDYIKDSKNAQQFISFPAKGSKAEGNIDFIFEKIGNHWVLQKLELTKQDGSKVEVVDSLMIHTCDSTMEGIDKLPDVIREMVKEQDGYMTLNRSDALNDFMQTAIVFDNEGNMGFEVLYSSGYTPENKQLYKLEQWIFDPDQLLELFYDYAKGTDLHLNAGRWDKLKEIHETEHSDIVSFDFGEG